MSVKIVLPNHEEPGPGRGTKIFTESGDEISGVQRCIIDIDPDSMITAHITVMVRDIENLEQIAGHVHIAGIFPEDESEHEQIVDRINQLRATGN